MSQELSLLYFTILDQFLSRYLEGEKCEGINDIMILRSMESKIDDIFEVVEDEIFVKKLEWPELFKLSHIRTIDSFFRKVFRTAGLTQSAYLSLEVGSDVLTEIRSRSTTLDDGEMSLWTLICNLNISRGELRSAFDREVEYSEYYKGIRMIFGEELRELAQRFDVDAEKVTKCLFMTRNKDKEVFRLSSLLCDLCRSLPEIQEKVEAGKLVLYERDSYII